MLIALVPRAATALLWITVLPRAALSLRVSSARAELRAHRPNVRLDPVRVRVNGPLDRRVLHANRIRRGSDELISWQPAKALGPGG